MSSGINIDKEYEINDLVYGISNEYLSSLVETMLQRLEVDVIKNNRILKYLLMMVVSLFLILNFSIGVSASSGYDRQEVDTCITISQRVSVKGGSGTTKLYRSMSQAEYDSVIQNQKFVPYDLAMEDKWFATTQENETKWGDIFYPDGNYRILEVEVDTNSLNKMYYVDYLDNIGPAY